MYLCIHCVETVGIHVIKWVQTIRDIGRRRGKTACWALGGRTPLSSQQTASELSDQTVYNTKNSFNGLCDQFLRTGAATVIKHCREIHKIAKIKTNDFSDIHFFCTKRYKFVRYLAVNWIIQLMD